MSWINNLFLILGAAFILLAAVGLMILPDLYTRMQATTKASTFGMICILLGTGLHFGTSSALITVTVSILFIFITAPVGVHMIARNVYSLKSVAKLSKTMKDDLKQRYNQK